MPRISGSSHGKGIQAVLLALKILEHLAQHRGAVGVTELARALATTKNRIHRHLQTLIEGGYVLQDEGDERYRVSARLMVLGVAVGENYDLSIAARPAITDLRATLGHSVAISVPEFEGVRVVAVLRGGSKLEIGVKPGSLLAFHTSSQGKIALAYGDRQLRERVLGQELEESSSESIVDPAKLGVELAAIRTQGWATSANQTVLGLNALAAPIFDALGHYVGAIAIVDSLQFIPERPNQKQLDSIMNAAARISRTLGNRQAS